MQASPLIALKKHFLKSAAKTPLCAMAKSKAPAAKPQQLTIAKKMASTRKPGQVARGQPRKLAAPKPQQVSQGAGAGGHTIMLLQETKNLATRTWSEHPTLRQALDYFVSSYERQLKALNPQARELSYTVEDLHVYIDSMADLSALIFAPATKHYMPRNKTYLKQQLLLQLQSAAR